VAARALEFAILTAGRTGEVIGAHWDEIDIARRLWTVSADRMKAGREHRVPLSERAVEIIAKMKKHRLDGQEFVFAGARGGPLSNMALLMTLRRMGYAALTTHGFRSTFRDWAAERSEFPSEVADSDGPVVGRRPGDSKLLCFLASSCGEPQNRIKFLEC